ncbi:hypothetical protein A0256_02360 [Mucilaginibacter sp. PAMC 26640]|nr:hypothetical protein A0256_02360 [Mucilaginibacter sp. PAMC 26640]
MLYPKKNAVVKWVFDTYVKWAVSRQFHELLYDEIAVDKNRSVLLVGNHFSFWDGLILYSISKKLFRKKFHVMILQETATRSGILRYGGAFSVSKNSKDLIRSLDYAAELLAEPGNLVLMFPQGKLYSNFVQKVNFEKGILRIIKKAEGKFQLIFAATFIQYFKHKQPNATVYLKAESTSYANKTIDDLQTAYQQHYDISKKHETEIEI